MSKSRVINQEAFSFSYHSFCTKYLKKMLFIIVTEIPNTS